MLKMKKNHKCDIKIKGGKGENGKGGAKISLILEAMTTSEKLKTST